MGKSRNVLGLLLIIALVFFMMGCSTKGDASSPDIQNSPNNDPVNTPNDTITDDEDLGGGTEYEPEDVGITTTTNYGFEEDLGDWQISDWESESDGELGCVGLERSEEQKASGIASAAISCKFIGETGDSKTAKGAFKLSFEEPVDLYGKVISAKVYIPETLLTEEFASAPYGFMLYIKTGDSWSWSDGGWNDTVNDLESGWNELNFAPIGVKEGETREIGIQISKGGGSPDWEGIIYIDDISY